ncbi:MAG: ABC transporter permease [Pseudomonadota bacterium]
MERLQRYYRNRGFVDAALSFLDLLFVSIVRDFRETTGNSHFGILAALSRPILLFTMFYVMFELIGLRTMVVRGDFFIFMMTGIFLFLSHILAVRRLRSTSHSTSGMIYNQKTSALLSILTSALTELYILTLSLFLIAGTGYLIQGELDVHRPLGVLYGFVLAWASGLAVGMMFMMAEPYAPGLVNRLFMFYRRAQLFTSGKMFLANSIPLQILPFFAWNPLFHLIDQARGAAFVNYFPKHTSWEYPIYLSLTLLAIGLIGEFAYRVNQNRGLS